MANLREWHQQREFKIYGYLHRVLGGIKYLAGNQWVTETERARLFTAEICINNILKRFKENSEILKPKGTNNG